MSGLQTGVPATDNGNRGMVQCLRKRIFYTQGATETTVGAIPAYASVIGGGVHVVTAFNDSGTETLDVGIKNGSSADDPNAYATLLTLSAVGYIPIDELGTTTNIMQTVDSLVTCTYNGQNSNASAGEAYVLIFYVTRG